MSRPTSKVANVRVTGPLAPFAAGFRARLQECGYTPLSAVNAMRLMAHLSRWLDANGLGAADLTSEQAERYAAARRAGGYTSARLPRSIAPILAMLAGTGVLAPEAPAAPVSEQEKLLAAFERHLLGERALAASTAAAYVARARRFLEGPGGSVLSSLTAGHITRAVLAETAVVSAGSAQYFVAALRAFLRFCFLEGLVEADLASAALAVTGRRRSPLPLGISRVGAQALLASCDRRRPAGRRDYAVLVLLLRLGLRASEVAALTLEDIDWRAGEITVHGKAAVMSGFPCPPTSARRSPPISPADVRSPGAARCSCAWWHPPGRWAAAGSLFSSAGLAAGPASRRSGHTGCGTPPLAGWQMPAHR